MQEVGGRGLLLSLRQINQGGKLKKCRLASAEVRVNVCVCVFVCVRACVLQVPGTTMGFHYFLMLSHLTNQTTSSHTRTHTHANTHARKQIRTHTHLGISVCAVDWIFSFACFASELQFL